MLNEGNSVKLDGQLCRLSKLDLNSNLAPVGCLWVIRTEDTGSQTVKGIVHRFTKQFSPITNVDNVFPNVPDMETIVALYKEEFPDPPSLMERLKNFLAKLFKKKQAIIEDEKNYREIS